MNSLPNPFVGIESATPLLLGATENFPPAGHLWSQAQIDALILAYAARRPLLVRGEAGSGKSQIARAAAHVLGVELLVEMIHPRFEAHDLLYRLDAVERLADAQMQRLASDNEKYIKRGRLWLAIEQITERSVPVLLIDEIDKADADVPNSLLEVLGNRSFTVPPLEHRVIRAPADRVPLIVITTNEERELPAAFVRRCAVLNLNPPESDAAFIEWLIKRGGVHTQLNVVDAVRRQAAQQVWEDRQAAMKEGYTKVGLAEYVDLLTALDDLTSDIQDLGERHSKQVDWLKRLSAYALVKNAGQTQDRPVDSGTSGKVPS